LPKAAVDFAYSARARDVCLWSGAGVSADPPADLPLGDTLTREAIRTLCASRVRDAVEDEFRRAGMEDSSGRRKTMPRLEWVLEHAFRVAGDDALRALDSLKTGSYNELHVTLAEHLAQGGAHITVNLDSCIENAARGHGLPVVEPIHLHGSIRDAAPENLIVRTGQLGVGLTATHSHAIRSALAKVELLAFAGYSGRDYFDVDPFFAEWAREGGGLEHLTVVWVAHADRGLASREWRDARGLDGVPMLRALETLGADCHYVVGDTREFLSELAAAAGLTAPTRRRGSGQASAGPRPPDPPDTARRWLVEGHLWWSMGHGGRVVELDRLIPRSPDPQGLADRLLEVRWVGYRNVGLYDKSIALLRSVEPRGHRLSMLGSDFELRGNRWRAGLLHARAVAESPVQEDGSDAYHHAVDAHLGYVHWWSRERRTVLGWPLLGLTLLCIRALRRALRHRVLDAMDPIRAFERFVDAERYFDEHPHAVNQLANIRVRWRRVRRLPLPAHLNGRHVPGRDIFVETDHFLGYVNAERSDLRRRLAAGELSAAEVDRHRERAAQIGDRPGVLKAALLQRALGHAVASPRAERAAIHWAVGRRWRWRAKWALLTLVRGRRGAIGRRLASWLVRL
jgi:hypothetical protein